MSRSLRPLIGTLLALTIPTSSLFPDECLGQPIVLNDDGAWCWFQDERAIIIGTKLLVGSIANGRSNAGRKGDVDLAIYDLETGCLSRQVLHHRLQPDDHAVPALWETPDGRVVAVYSKHGSEN